MQTPAILAVGAAVTAATSVELPSSAAGWVALAAGVLGGLALYRAGSVRAWKETAEARDARIGDLETELGELRAELAIPERIEGIIRLMSETAEHQEAAATERLERALDRVDERWAKHDAAAERRTQRLERAIEALTPPHGA